MLTFPKMDAANSSTKSSNNFVVDFSLNYLKILTTKYRLRHVLILIGIDLWWTSLILTLLVIP